MLPKNHRLTKTKDFDKVFKEGRSSYDKIMGVKASANGLAASRFGILISAKISKKSVVRNRLKRQIGETLRKELASIRPGFDVMIITLPSIRAAGAPDIQASLKRNLGKAGLLK